MSDDPRARFAASPPTTGGSSTKPDLPRKGELVMVYDAYYDGWTIGAWDDWWTTVGQGDDCWVIAWSPLVFPAVPEAPDPNDDEYEARRV